MSCAVGGCRSHVSRKENGQELVTFHRFPKDELKKNQWINLIGRQNWSPQKQSRICSKHFTLDSFTCNQIVKWRRLREDAIPSLFLMNRIDEMRVLMAVSEGEAGSVLQTHNTAHHQKPSYANLTEIQNDVAMEVETEPIFEMPSCEIISHQSQFLQMGKVATADAMRFMTDCLKTVGAAAKAAEQQAELLIQADRFGHPSHGLNRIEMYVNDILSGACKPNNEPKVLKETVSTAWIDANSVLGATVSHFAMDIVIKKAKETGVAWVTVKGSNHNGMLGFWAQKAADKGLIGMAFTNTSPLLAPTRSKKSALGTNPIAVVAPACNGESFYLDMATSAVAFGKIEMQRRKGEPIPSGWAQGPDGNETLDAELAVKTAVLMPLGGSEKTSGYKGFGLAAMVELFCGITAGANYGHHIRSWAHSGKGGPANLGHCFVAVDPCCFAPGFGDRLTESIQYWRQLEPADPCLPVLAPGDKEKMAAAESDACGTVSFVKQQIESSAALADRLKVKPMTVLE